MALLTVEYLTLIRDPDSFCDTAESFVRLLQIHSSIIIAGNDVRFEGIECCTLEIAFGELKAKKQRYFQLRLDWQGDPDVGPVELGRFHSLLRTIRGVISKAGGEVETLQDDVSSHYSRKAYPLIHDVENLMRRLIANFMLLNVGIEWTSEALPLEAEKALRNSKRDSGTEKSSQDYLNVLQKLDFIHLGNILFDPYSKKTTAELFIKLKSAKSETDIEAMQEFIPRSNWHRYFSSLVQCEDEYLNRRWKQLYDLRCKVAHNNFMSKKDLDEIHRLIGEVQPKLVEAIDKLRQVTVPQVEMDSVAESAARNINEAVGEFIFAWQDLEATIQRRFLLIDGIPRRAVPSNREIEEWCVMDIDQMQAFQQLRELRNRVVHGLSIAVPPEEIRDATLLADDLDEAISEESFVARLRRLPEEARNHQIVELLETVRFDILESDGMGTAMAETNATDFEVDEQAIQGVQFSGDVCVVEFSFTASGEQLDDKMWHGTSISGSGTATIDWEGGVEVDDICAGVDHEEPDEDYGKDRDELDFGSGLTDPEF